MKQMVWIALNSNLNWKKYYIETDLSESDESTAAVNQGNKIVSKNRPNIIFWDRLANENQAENDWCVPFLRVGLGLFNK